MDTFNNLLQRLKEDEEAGFIAQILNEEIELYSRIADQIADNDLHPIIADMKNNAIEYQRAEEEKKKKEKEEWMKNLFN